MQDAARTITSSLHHQESDCKGAVDFLAKVQDRTRVNEDSIQKLDTAIQGLAEQASDLRQYLHRFKL